MHYLCHAKQLFIFTGAEDVFLCIPTAANIADQNKSKIFAIEFNGHGEAAF